MQRSEKRSACINFYQVDERIISEEELINETKGQVLVRKPGY